jgi:solute carrier family 34 (sodium-dependent phosphate cotransporter)
MGARRRRPSRIAGIVSRVLLGLTALWLFAVALQLIRTGAGGLQPLLDFASITGVSGHLGFGWLGSYVLLSGSPVAAVSLSLFTSGLTSDTETFAMINGSRLGASLIVLVVGFASYATGRRNPDGLYIGVVALLTAITLWTPAIPIGLLILERGWLDGVHVQSPGALTDTVDLVTQPVVELVDSLLPRLALFAAGVGALLLSFTAFDRILPNLEGPSPRIEALSRVLQRRYSMFGFGMLVTMVTLSVSLSVTVLVPLALKGYVRRDRVIPYVMGANIATWIDTLFAALLLNSPRAFTIVMVEMIAGSVVSLAILVFLFGPYSKAILATAGWVSSGKPRFVGFLVCLFAAPAFLILV